MKFSLISGLRPPKSGGRKMRPSRNFVLSQIFDIGRGSAKFGEMANFLVIFGGRYLGPRKSDQCQILDWGSEKYGASFSYVEKFLPTRAVDSADWPKTGNSRSMFLGWKVARL
jgi:hypothetical protein